MHKIIPHSDNLMEGIQKKIALKIALESNKKQKLISKTKTSELRS